MDVADYEFARIPEFDMKELKLFETTLPRGKKRAADEGTADHGAMGEKKARLVGPVKIGREAAAQYWQSLIDAGRDLGIRTEEMKEEAICTPPNYLRSLKLKVRASTTRTSNKAFVASMRAKVNLVAQAQSTSTIQDAKFKCTHCDKQVFEPRQSQTSEMTLIDLQVELCSFESVWLNLTSVVLSKDLGFLIKWSTSEISRGSIPPPPRKENQHPPLRTLT